MAKEKQFKKFEAKLSELSFNRKCNLNNMLIGPVTAALLARWILSGSIDITHLILAKNNLGDEGLEKLTTALSVNKTIVAVDMSQNCLTPKSAQMIAHIISSNEAIVDLNLGSFQGSMRNRLGKDGGLAIAYGFSMNRSLIQYLHLKSTTIGNEELELIA